MKLLSKTNTTNVNIRSINNNSLIMITKNLYRFNLTSIFKNSSQVAYCERCKTNHDGLCPGAGG